MMSNETGKTSTFLMDDTFRFGNTDDPMEPDIMVFASDGSGSGSGTTMYVSSQFTSSTSAFMGQMFGGGYVVSQAVPSPVDEEGVIIIQATPEQVAAAHEAYADAGIVVYGSQVLAALAGIAVARSAAGVAAAELGTIFFGADEIRDYIADALYQFDGYDGSYDGQYQTQHSHYSILGGDGGIPDYPSH